MAALVLAHRGANRRAEENTLDALRLAIDLGADGIETDVRRSADGVLLLHHDAERPGLGLLGDLPFERIRAVAPQVPTLDEALDVLLATGRPVLNLELKCCGWEPDADRDGSVGVALVDVVRARGIAEQVIVSSFDLDAVSAIHDRAPEIPTAWLTMADDLEAASAFAAMRGHRYLHPYREHVMAFGPEATVATARAHGLGVNVWTVNDEAEIDAMLAAGVDAIVSDVPDVVLDRVRGRRS